jgi:hypothetical protein
LYVNGNYMGRGPSRYQNQRPERDSRDIRRALQPGRNTIVVLVHRDAPTGRIMSHDPGFVAALELTISGRKEVISTDSSWLSMPERSFGPRAQAWASIAEHIDSRKTTDWTRPTSRFPSGSRRQSFAAVEISNSSLAALHYSLKRSGPGRRRRYFPSISPPAVKSN